MRLRRALLTTALVAAGCSVDVAAALDAAAPDAGGLVSAFPTECRLGEVVIPGGSDAVTAACLRLYHVQGVQARVCSPPGSEASPEREFVDACVAQATAPGVLLRAADLEACAVATCERLCFNDAPCLRGLDTDMLSPSGSVKGSLAPASPCVSGDQCDSGVCGGCEPGYCYSPLCSRACSRLVPLGGSCALLPGEPVGTPVCARGSQCRAGTCVATGQPDGASCVWYYGSEGCQHRCLEPDYHSPGVCAPLGKVGEWCGGANYAPECEPGLYCQFPDYTCARFLDDGQACDPAGPARCRHLCLDTVCGLAPYGHGVGERCYEGIGCLPELECFGGRCTVPKVPDPGPPGPDLGLSRGAACQIGGLAQCPDDQLCWTTCDTPGCIPGDQGHCVDAPGAGEPCLDFSTCGAGLECYGGRCLAPSGEGGPCPCRVEAVCGPDGVCVAWGPAACR